MRRIHLWEPGTGQRSIEVIRSAAVALAVYAVDGPRGRGVDDVVHDWVTEGRRRRNEERRRRGSPEVPYSSCGDLAHWMLTCLGCRDESVVNRTDDGGVRDWAMAVNLSRLTRSPWYVADGNDREPEMGDILYVANGSTDGHVCVLTQIVAPEQWVTADYGQPYGAQRVCQITRGDRGRIVRGKRLRGWVDLAQVPFTEPAVVPDSFVGGVVDDNPYRVWWPGEVGSIQG